MVEGISNPFGNTSKYSGYMGLPGFGISEEALLKRFVIIAILSAILATGCSSGDSVLTSGPGGKVISGEGAHNIWGIWQFVADPRAGRLDVVPLRTPSMHLNALPFLEPPALVNLTLESLQFNGNIIECDIGLRHPFLGLNEFTGFDVCGVLITSGSVSGFNDSELAMAGDGDTRLLNPDGYTRWWNPAEFPHGNSMFDYKDGLLGTPDATADYNSTLNAYKFFCDNLTDPDASVGTLSPANRCVFGAGKKNIRHYIIELGADGLVFNYAVDACWQFPSGTPTWDVPDDFGPNANRPEAWNLSIEEVENTLWNDGASSGGALTLLIGVWDHYGSELNTVKVESPGNLAAVSSNIPVDTDIGLSHYYLLISDATPDEGEIELLISIECDQAGYGGVLPGKPVTAYFTHTVDVANHPPTSSTLHLLEPNGGESIQQGCPFTIEWESSGDPIADVKLEYSTDGFMFDTHSIIDSTPNDGAYVWDTPEMDSTTVRVRVSDVLNPSIKDISDADFSINAPGDPIWHKYKYSPSNQGVSPYTGPSTDNVIWTFPCSASTTPGPSIGYDGTIYVGTNDGHVHAVSPEGDELWTISVGAFVLGTPAIAQDGTVYAGSWGPGRLYAIHCEGDIKWEFDTSGDINKCHPALADDGTIYIGNNLGRFWAVNPDGTEKWHYDSGGGYVPSPAIGPDGEVYFAMSGGHVYGINDIGQGSYSIFWNHNFAGEHITNSPSVDDDGVVYCCGLYLNTMWACDPYTDTILWTFDAPDGFDEASPSIGPDGTIYIGCNNNMMYAVNPGGAVKWSTPVDGRVPSSVIIDPAGHLYFGTRGGTIYCLDADDGGVVWSYPTGDMIRATAAIAPDGTMYIGGHDAMLRAFKDS